MLSIDGSDVEDGSDWFCYHSSSRLLFPINFCQLNNIPLSLPNGTIISSIHRIEQNLSLSFHRRLSR